MTTAIEIEITAGDLAPWRAGRNPWGIDYVHRFDSSLPGPKVLILALTHGNEVCGAFVVQRLLGLLAAGLVPARGALTLAFANVAALARWNRAQPHANRFIDEDLNRVWGRPLATAAPATCEQARARELLPMIEDTDFLLDLHSMHNPHPPVLLCGTQDKGVALARAVGVPAVIVRDGGHANGTRLRDYGGFGDPASQKNALLAECGQHWEARSIDVAWRCTWRFLLATGVFEANACPPDAVTPPAPTRLIEVTDTVVAQHVDFKFEPGLGGLSVLPNAGDLIATDGGKRVVAPYANCVLIMPTLIHVKPGLTAVRLGRYVD